ncbi:MAG TPA: hypothetical protein VHA57_06055 [Actinomycetota bacterium]|nr:hypothetical protein [Actinomycetota bacterium]
MPGKRLLLAAVAVLAAVVVSVLMLFPAAPAIAGGPPARRVASVQHAGLTSPSPSLSPIPAGPPPGERNPIEGAAAVIAIVIVAAAGIFIYGVIRKGL